MSAEQFNPESNENNGVFDADQEQFGPHLDFAEWDGFYDSIGARVARLAELAKEQKALDADENLDFEQPQRRWEIQLESQQLTSELMQVWSGFFAKANDWTGRLDILAEIMTSIEDKTELKSYENYVWPRTKAIANQLRPIPYLLSGNKQPKEVQAYIREQFQSLPESAIYRMVCLDFETQRDIRLFPAQVASSGFDEKFTETVLNRMAFEFAWTYSRSDASRNFINDTFDLDKMINGEPSEDEDGELLEAEGDEQKAAVLVLFRQMLPMSATFNKQAAKIIDEFTAADWDLDNMSQLVQDAFPFIEEAGLQPDAIIDDMEMRLKASGIIEVSATTSSNTWSDFDDIVMGLTVEDPVTTPDDLSEELDWLDPAGKHWSKLIGQLRALNTGGDAWQKLLKTAQEGTKKELPPAEKELIEQIDKLDAEMQEIIDNAKDDNGKHFTYRYEWPTELREQYQALNQQRRELDTRLRHLRNPMTTENQPTDAERALKDHQIQTQLAELDALFTSIKMNRE